VTFSWTRVRRVVRLCCEVITLTAFAVVVASWTWSYRTGINIDVDGNSPSAGARSSPFSYRLRSVAGQIAFEINWSVADAELIDDEVTFVLGGVNSNQEWAWATWPANESGYTGGLLGFGRTGNTSNYGHGATEYYQVYWLPHYALALSTLLASAALFLIPAVRSRRIARFLCPACSYDLRATPDRCPECGHPVPSPGTSGEG
jgi:hypothetical protein